MKRLPLYEHKHARSGFIGELFADRIVDAQEFLHGRRSIAETLRIARYALKLDVSMECALQTPFFALEGMGRTFLGYAAFLRAVELWSEGFRSEENIVFDVSPGLGAHIASQMRHLNLDGIGSQFFMLQHFALSEMCYTAELERKLRDSQTHKRKIANLARAPEPFYHLSSKGVLRRAYRQLWHLGENLLQINQFLSRVSVEMPPFVTTNTSGGPEGCCC